MVQHWQQATAAATIEAGRAGWRGCSEGRKRRGGRGGAGRVGGRGGGGREHSLQSPQPQDVGDSEMDELEFHSGLNSFPILAP